MTVMWPSYVLMVSFSFSLHFTLTFLWQDWDKGYSLCHSVILLFTKPSHKQLAFEVDIDLK